jgi:uncharacterized protein YpuA (DUF1002 family)
VYTVTAQVDQLVQKRIEFLVIAESPDGAKDLVREAAQQYPEPVHTAQIKAVVTTALSHQPPISVDFISVKKGLQNG